MDACDTHIYPAFREVIYFLILHDALINSKNLNKKWKKKNPWWQQQELLRMQQTTFITTTSIIFPSERLEALNQGVGEIHAET